MSVARELYIDGQWVAAADGERMDVVDPATEAVVDSVPVATPADVERALAAAERAWRQWREVDAWSRSAVLRRAAALTRERVATLATVLTEEVGKPLAEAEGELRAAADQFDWYADEARRVYGRVVQAHSQEHRILVLRQPIGPVAAFSPWNFPALLSVRKIAPAVATGCSIIVKPSREAPRTVLELARVCADAGVPAGVVNVVTGDSGAISRQLVLSEVIRKVSLTGSVPVGREILRLCAEQIKPASMELGGHSPVLVFADADVARAAEVCARGKFRNCGQVCIAASRFFVQEPVLKAFTARFVEVTRSLRIGDGRAPGTEVGPLANARRVAATEALIGDAVSKGATLCCGGHRPAGFAKGFFFAPTVLGNVSAEMLVMREEPFAPIAPITAFSGLEDGLRAANATRFGLAAYVFTGNTRTAFLAAEGLEAGMVGVNNLAIATAEAPFGGIKESGYGREGGSEGVEAYTTVKYVNLKL